MPTLFLCSFFEVFGVSRIRIGSLLLLEQETFFYFNLSIIVTKSDSEHVKLVVIGTNSDPLTHFFEVSFFRFMYF